MAVEKVKTKSKAKAKAKAKTYEYQAEMKQLLHLIIHSLYTHPEIFLRELISNASDALNKVRYQMLTDKNILNADAELAIKITFDEKTKEMVIQDNGIGMTEEELINNLGTIARSGTLDFVEKLKESKKGSVEGDLIGQFGVGFYSVFMVADEVTVETRQANKDSKAVKWVSSGEGAYTVEEIEKEDKGTKITFKMKDSVEDLAKEYTLKSTISKYSNFAEFPIYLGEEKINSVSALWRKNPRDVKKEELIEFYKYVSHESEEPLDHLHLSIEGADVEFKALLFIPKKAPTDLLRMTHLSSPNLYTNKIMIKDNCEDLLPEHLRFVKGVVDTSDLPLNVSREMIQNSPVMDKIKSILTTKILAFIKKMAEKEEEKYLTFYKNYGPLLKTGINSDYTNRDKLIELLRVPSTTTEGDVLTSFKSYCSRMKENQKDIYYISGEKRLDLQHNPNLEYFKKNDIEVFFVTEPVEAFVFPSIHEYDGKSVKSIDKDDIDLEGTKEDKEDKKEETEEKSSGLLSLFKDTLGEKIEKVVVSKRLVDSPVTLVMPKESMDPQMIKMMKMMGQEVPDSKKIMEINVDHPLISNLSKMQKANSKDAFLKTCVTQLFDCAKLIEGDMDTVSNADFARRMTDIMSEATK